MRYFQSILAVSLIAMSGWSVPASCQSAFNIPSYPPEVSLVDEGERGFVYRETRFNLRLYTYDDDIGGVSACTGKCIDAWPPLLASPSAKPVGAWTIVNRDGANRQWAYHGKPVYMRFHDSPSEPTGDGIQGKWHLVPYTKNP